MLKKGLMDSIIPSKSFLNSYQLDVQGTAFDKLMQRRIFKVLLICSSYDAFTLEEDGRIDEQIFNEYVALNLRYPPVFIQAHSTREVAKILANEHIDLIISMLNVGGTDTFSLAKMLKKHHPLVPIVVLTHFSREVSFRLQNEDLSAIDYVFCWLGNADLLLAIIKLIEDKMNAKHDILDVGVQCIILVEDSIRYYSSLLPNIYKLVFKQSLSFMSEALNEHQRMLRMRGRPKILLATTYSEAIELYHRYSNNVLGVISDVSYKVNNRRDQETKAGLKLCKEIRANDPYLPIVLQSSDASNRPFADEIEAGFVHKYSKTYNNEIQDFIVNNFGFGDFVFRNPDTNAEIARASNLKELQQVLLTISDESLRYHTSRNHLSRWLNARALFSIAEIFKPISLTDFKTTKDLRSFLSCSFSAYRLNKGRRVISKFNRNTFDEYSFFSRIGEGSIGGKARGLAFINQIVSRHGLFNKYPNTVICIPRTVAISTEYFDEFMGSNNLWEPALRISNDADILNLFLLASLPNRLLPDLKRVVEVLQRPLAVRSSSKLEDSHYQPFAGIYSTYMVPRSNNLDLMLQMLTMAIKGVYASVFYRASKAYMDATQNVIDEEKMGIIIQEICGSQHDNMYYPTFSGVARSINFYPIGDEKPEDGTASVGYGLGKLIVDGEPSLRFSPRYPKKVLQLSKVDMALVQGQKFLYALNTDPNSFSPQVDDSSNLMKIDIGEAKNFPDVHFVASTYNITDQMLYDGFDEKGPKVVTFNNILKHGVFSLGEILMELLEIGRREMNNNIEIEFAANLNVPDNTPRVFNFLQIRPIVDNEQSEVIDWKGIDVENALVYSKSALGHGTIGNVSHIVYVKPGSFDRLHTVQIANEVEAMNRWFVANKLSYVLIGPGRWGSSIPTLGVPIKWSQISEAKVIIESGLENFRVDPSQGTHFFQNLTSFRVAYLTINPHIGDGTYQIEQLDTQLAIKETDFVRCVEFSKPLVIKIDGRSNRGVIIMQA